MSLSEQIQPSPAIQEGSASGQLPLWLGACALVLCDVGVLCVSFLTATATWMMLRPDVPAEFYLHHWPTLLFFPAVYWLNGLYKSFGMSSVDELRKCVVSTTVAFLVLIAVSFLVKESALYSRGIASLAWCITVCTLPLARHAAKRVLTAKRLYGCEATLIGTPRLMEKIWQSILRHPELGFRIGRRISLGEDGDGSGDENLERLLGQGTNRSVWTGAGTCILAVSGRSGEAMAGLITMLTKAFDCVILVPDLASAPSLWVGTTDLSGLVGIEMRDNLLRRSSQIIKRVLDVLLCALGAIPVGLVALCVAVAVRLTSVGPVVYSQNRLGRGGVPFRVYKFRTMVVDAREVLEEHLQRDARLAEEWRRTQKLKQDPRLTGIGGFLRRSSLDELPQLWNVLRGEMSLVGPRPIVEAEVCRFGEAYPMYSRVTPGLSGLWQTSGRSRTTYEERVELDSYYVRNWSVWLDLHILMRTAWIVLNRDGAY